MILKTPKFWYDQNVKIPSLAGKILSGLSRLYLAASEARAALRIPAPCAVPVICIGNLTAGGAGKTPTAIAVMEILRREKFAAAPYFLTRGYGGHEPGPLLVESRRHGAEMVGDESLLLAARAPTIVSRNRALGAKEALKRGANIIVMDDGLQNLDLQKDIKILVIDGAMGFGNKKALPAGPLRQSLKSGLANADAFVLIGEDSRGIAADLPKDKPLFKAYIKPSEDAPASGDYVAFAGIAYPEKFFATLRALGLNLKETVSFSDHYAYKPGDIDRLVRKAKKSAARLITTEKDFVRLPSSEMKIEVLRIDLEFEKEKAFADFLKSKLPAAAISKAA